jgi:hypothetical protein
MISNVIVGATHALPSSIKVQNTKPKEPPPQSLSAIVGSSKSAATKRMNKRGLINNQSIWQRHYYENVIRINEDYHRIVEHIQFNPTNWEEDQEFIPNDMDHR